MTDLTTGSIHHHLGRLTGVILIGMVFQTLYYLVDLYFVAQVGSAAVAPLSVWLLSLQIRRRAPTTPSHAS